MQKNLLDPKEVEKRLPVINSICQRALYLATQMIWQANNRSDKSKGDPKVGGHPAASSSALHIMGTLHLLVKTGFDFIANKPHASPTDHAFNYLLDLFFEKDGTLMSLERKNQAMLGLRKFSVNGEPVFQSYHSALDPDHHHFLPTGTVGIPPVQAGYLSLAYRFAREHGYQVPEAHFWCVSGDSEFREGSMYEAIPDFAERELGNLTWIIDYNRQSLDGHRITNKKIMQGSDSTRIERTLLANGWNVIQVRHGSLRKKLFQEQHGDVFKNWLESELEDYELQALLLIGSAKELVAKTIEEHPHLKEFLKRISENYFYNALRDFGGHDVLELFTAFKQAKESREKPTLVIAHTLKGWGLKCAAQSGNHSLLPDWSEVQELQKQQGIANDVLFQSFAPDSLEGRYCFLRGSELKSQMLEQSRIKKQNEDFFKNQLSDFFQKDPKSLNIQFKMANYPHTQWMLGQLTAKLTRIANTPLDQRNLKPGQKPLSEDEQLFKPASELFLSMAPDVGTSTNLNPAMDGKVFAATSVEDYESEFGVKDQGLPDLVPGEDVSDRFLRFEIAEGNVISCVGSFGKLKDYLGIPLIPMMTVYDFFIKRALDQYFYNLYWKSGFICVGTPSGVTLSPEGAQHGWKSDFQIPGQITWEPAFVQELDWILVDAIKRHLKGDNLNRNGVLIRGVTRGVEQKDFLKFLRMQKRFKDLNGSVQLCRSEYPLEGAANEAELKPINEELILSIVREEVLSGAYPLIHYLGYAGYEPGDNVVHIFTMGAIVTEAILASEELLAKGIYANVFVVTSPDLLAGNLAHETDYAWLKKLGVNGSLHIKAKRIGANELGTLSGLRTPIVSAHDGEPGLLDNLGSIVGVKQVACAVRKHSKCGRPSDVYAYHGIDAASIVNSAMLALERHALEDLTLQESI